MAKISPAQLAKYAVDLLEDKVPATTVAHSLAGFLIFERRTKDSAAVFRAIEQEFSVRGSDRVTITSVHEVSESFKRQLAGLLNARNPVFESVLDPSVIGGVKAESGEFQIDLTVRSKINRFKQHVTM